jgi:hypothetical protein
MLFLLFPLKLRELEKPETPTGFANLPVLRIRLVSLPEAGIWIEEAITLIHAPGPDWSLPMISCISGPPFVILFDGSFCLSETRIN